MAKNLKDSAIGNTSSATIESASPLVRSPMLIERVFIDQSDTPREGKQAHLLQTFPQSHGHQTTSSASLLTFTLTKLCYRSYIARLLTAISKKDYMKPIAALRNLSLLSVLCPASAARILESACQRLMAQPTGPPLAGNTSANS